MADEAQKAEARRLAAQAAGMKLAAEFLEFVVVDEIPPPSRHDILLVVLESIDKLRDVVDDLMALRDQLPDDETK